VVIVTPERVLTVGHYTPNHDDIVQCTRPESPAGRNPPGWTRLGPACKTASHLSGTARVGNCWPFSHVAVWSDAPLWVHGIAGGRGMGNGYD
jgi:hypothetical protein